MCTDSSFKEKPTIAVEVTAYVLKGHENDRFRQRQKE